LIPSKS